MLQNVNIRHDLHWRFLFGILPSSLTRPERLGRPPTLEATELTELMEELEGLWARDDTPIAIRLLFLALAGLVDGKPMRITLWIGAKRPNLGGHWKYLGKDRENKEVREEIAWVLLCDQTFSVMNCEKCQNTSELYCLWLRLLNKCTYETSVTIENSFVVVLIEKKKLFGSIRINFGNFTVLLLERSFCLVPVMQRLLIYMVI